LWGRLAGLAAGVPVLVTTEHGKELWKNRLQVRCDRVLSRRTCMHIAVSQDGMRIRMTRERVPAAKIVHIPNGVPVDDPAPRPQAEARARGRAAFGLRADQPVLGTVGRVVEAKGYPHLREAVVALKRELPDLHWLQVGTGDALTDLRRRASRAGMAGAITFAGTRADVADLLAAMDVFVMSSIREGLPMALLEAMAARRPLVVTSAGGMAEVIEDQVSGLVVPPADPAALAAAVSRLLRDRATAERLALAAHARVKDHYSIEAAARRIEAVYHQCLAAKGLSG
jgi:glycosyltransferase involved in cell wall biosynthesis